jgi:hypothetical protein
MTGNGKRDREIKLDMGEICEERFLGFEYHQGVSIR